MLDTIESTFTKVPNALLENVCKSKLNATQIKIILVVIRYTFGFNRDDHDLSEKFISKAIKADRTQLSKEIKKLIGLNVLNVTIEPTPNSSRRLKINGNYSV